jgi:Dyp-type peroxidase family
VSRERYVRSAWTEPPVAQGLIHVVTEEQLELADIQGAIIPGFKKDNSALLAIRIKDPASCKSWLKARAPEIARADEVLRFNRVFKAIVARRRGEAQAPKAVWVSISFSAEGLSLLRSPNEIKDAFPDNFVGGMYQRILHDAPPDGWVIGGSAETVPHVLLVVAADDPKARVAEVKRLRTTITELKVGRKRALKLMGAPQIGATLPCDLKGHEHFGFKDGVSQPAIRGVASDDPSNFIDARLLAPADPNFDLCAEPGRVLVWPGQFIIGYKRQNRLELIEPLEPFEPKVLWQRNGSFLVYRRLQQKVHIFWRFCTDQAKQLSEKAGREVTPEEFASLLVGRWPSGAPLVRAPGRDRPDLARDDNANNDFLFSEATPPAKLRDGSMAGAAFPPARPDPNGLICPFAAHIRKVNPRDDPSDTSGLRKTKIHLILRRGIPYGAAIDPAHRLEDDNVDRGLLFMSYQASIENQFEFVTKTWVNQDNSPHDSDPHTGQDPLIGQSPDTRFVRIAGSDHQIDLPAEPWVITTGGGYFFTPSISALSGALVG